MADKLLAEWFWIDRWMGSSAFLLPMEARGVYREMLTQAWRRGAKLPNDHEAIQRAIGATEKEWKRAWLLIERFWRVEGDSLVNDTQLEVYTDALARQEKSISRARAGAQARWNDKPEHVLKHVPEQIVSGITHAQPEQCPPSLSPSPVSDHQSLSPREPIALAGTLPRDLKHVAWISQRGKHVPIFLHEEFKAAVGGTPESADQRLRAFYEAVQAGWGDGPIGDDPVKLWRREFAAKFPSVASVARANAVDVTAKALERVQRDEARYGAKR